MANAILTFDQATLAAGVEGRSRSDGVPNQVVTITASDTGAGTYELELLSMAPTGDTPPTLTQATARTWTFTPPAGLLGRTYLFQLTVDRGAVATQDDPAGESVTRRTFAIRTEGGLRIPAPGERASPDASLLNMGADQIALSDDNEGGHPWGWAEAANVDRALRNIDVGNQVAVTEADDITGNTPRVLGHLYLEAGTYRISAFMASPNGESSEFYAYSEATAALLATLVSGSATLELQEATATVSIANAGYVRFEHAGDSGTAESVIRNYAVRRLA